MGPPCGLILWKIQTFSWSGDKKSRSRRKRSSRESKHFCASRRSPPSNNWQHAEMYLFSAVDFSPSMDVPQERIGPWIQAHSDGGRDMFVEKLTAFAKELGYSVFWEYPGKSRAWISLRDHVWGWGVQRFCPAWVPWCSMMIPESVFNVLGWLRMALRRFQGEFGTPFWWLRSARISGFSGWIKRFSAVSNGSMMIPGWFFNV